MVKGYREQFRKNICILKLSWRKWFHNLLILSHTSLVKLFIFKGLTTQQKLGMLHSGGLQLSYALFGWQRGVHTLKGFSQLQFTFTMWFFYATSSKIIHVYTARKGSWDAYCYLIFIEVQSKYNDIDLTANPTPEPHLPPKHTYFYMASLVRKRGKNSMAIVSVEQSSVGQYSLLVSPGV